MGIETSQSVILWTLHLHQTWTLHLTLTLNNSRTIKLSKQSRALVIIKLGLIR